MTIRAEVVIEESAADMAYSLIEMKVGAWAICVCVDYRDCPKELSYRRKR
jgi:hypothetical protein